MTDAVQQLYRARVDTYLSFISLFRYGKKGLRMVFARSGLLRSGLRVLDAGCGFGTPTFALLGALDERELPSSVLRTIGYGPNIFAVESFMDELAAKAKQDPYDFRRQLLKDERSLKVLETLAQKSDWRKRPAKGVARGMAYTEAFRSHIAHVVELSVMAEL